MTIVMQSLVVCAVFLCALIVAIVMTKMAFSVGLVDVPNERSSHSRPTPRGGGLGIFIAVTIGVTVCAPSWRSGIFLPGILVAGGFVAFIGLWDDIRSVTAP